MSKSVWVLGPLLVATTLSASSCSEDVDPQGSGGQSGAGAGTGGARSGGSGGQSSPLAAGGLTTGGVTWSAGGTSGNGGISFITTIAAQGASAGQPTQSSSAGGTVASGGSPSAGGQWVGSAGTGGTVAQSSGAAGAGIAGAAGGTAGTAGNTAGSDPRCATADVDQTLTAHLKITADNECDVYVNGQAVGQTSSWSSAVTIDVSLYVHPGRKNVVAVVGRNTSSQNGNDRGIIGLLTTTVGTTITPILVTDSSWVVSQAPGTDWTSLDYDASTWGSATEIAAAGDAPWGNVMGPGSEAKWIWFAPVPNSTSEKPNQESTYARRVFYFDFDGHVVDAASCERPVP